MHYFEAQGRFEMLAVPIYVVGIDYGTWMRGTQGRVLLSTGGSPLFERLANERFCAVVPLIVINTLVIVYELVLG